MKCKICGNKANNQMFKVKEMMFGFNEHFDYFECSECGCLQITEIPQNMFKYYPSNYYSFNEGNKPSTLEKIMRMQRDKYAITGNGVIGSILCKIFPPLHIDFMVQAKVNIESKVLDVGCGSGVLLKLLGDAGFTNLLGIDPFIDGDIEYENGVKILKKCIHDIDGKFDFIMFNHSFEHMPDPQETLNSASKLLSENGKIIMKIPTVSSFAWKKYNVNWVQLDAPRHFFLHSMKSIKLLASKSKLILNEYHYDSTEFQLWGSEQYLKNISLISDQSYATNPKKSVFSKNDIHDFKKIADELNSTEEGDRIVLYFSKNQ